MLFGPVLAFPRRCRLVHVASVDSKFLLSYFLPLMSVRVERVALARGLSIAIQASVLASVATQADERVEA